MMRFIYLCADDFGLDVAVDRGILNLILQQRLTSVSCMTDGPLWRHHGPVLREHKAGIAAGLHFNITAPLGHPAHPLSEWIVRACSGRIPRTSIEDALNRQLDRFEQVWQAPPDFVDGHQHVHVLPGIRQAVFRVLRQRYSGNLPWLRDSRPAQPFGSAKHLVLALLASGFATQASRQGFYLNRRLSGIYDFQSEPLYLLRLAEWIEQARDEQMLMCHPAFGLSHGDCEHLHAREQEYSQLSSPLLDTLLKEQQVAIRPFGARFHR